MEFEKEFEKDKTIRKLKKQGYHLHSIYDNEGRAEEHKQGLRKRDYNFVVTVHSGKRGGWGAWAK